MCQVPSATDRRRWLLHCPSACCTPGSRDVGSVSRGSSYGWASSLCYSADLARVAGRSLLLLALPWQYFAACIRTSSNSSPRTRSSKVPSLVLAKQRWNVSEACRLLDDAAHPTHSTNLGQARSAAAAEEGAGVTAGFGAAVRGGSAVTTRATPKIASPPPMSTTPVTGSDKITAPNNTATAGLT